MQNNNFNAEENQDHQLNQIMPHVPVSKIDRPSQAS